jgi:hypothetical protein
MKKNLSTEGLKAFRKDNTTPLKRRNTDCSGNPTEFFHSDTPSCGVTQDAHSPSSKLQSGHAATMLQQLIAEADNKAVVYSDDLSSVTRQQQMQGVQACQGDGRPAQKLAK